MLDISSALSGDGEVAVRGYQIGLVLDLVIECDYVSGGAIPRFVSLLLDKACSQLADECKDYLFGLMRTGGREGTEKFVRNLSAHIMPEVGPQLRVRLVLLQCLPTLAKQTLAVTAAAFGDHQKAKQILHEEAGTQN